MFTQTFVLFLILIVSTSAYVFPIARLNSPTLSSCKPQQWRKIPSHRSSQIHAFATYSTTANILKQPQASIELSAMKAVGKLLTTCGIGMMCSRTGLIDKNSLGVLSKLIFGLFQPCLLFVNIATTVAKLGSQGSALWLLPTAALLQIVLGMVVGKVVSTFIYGTKPSDEKNQLLICTAFGNSGPLPLVFVDALLRSHADSTMLPQSIGFISLYLLGWSPLFWILGPLMLQSTVAPAPNGWQVLERVLSPPVVASILGVVVGLVPTLRDLFLVDNPQSLGCANLIFESMRTLGTAYLPAVLLVLAGSLLPGPKDESSASLVSEPNTVPASNSNFAKQVFSIYIARFFLMPLLAFAVLPRMQSGLPGIGTLLRNKALMFVLLMEACMPSAQNSTVILQLLGDRAGAAKIARVLMAVYVLGIPALSYWLAAIMRTVFTA